MPAHSWWHHILHWLQAIKCQNFTALAHLPQRYMMLVGPVPHFCWLTEEFRPTLCFVSCLDIYCDRYWATENVATSLVVKSDAQSSIGSSWCHGTFSFLRKIPIAAKRISLITFRYYFWVNWSSYCKH